MKNECCKENGHRHYNVWKCIGWGILGVIGFAALLTLIGFAIMALWNWLVPGLLNLPVITFWQAIGLAVLSRLLFGGCGKGFHHFRHKHHGCHCHCKCHGEHDDECCKPENSSQE